MAPRQAILDALDEAEAALAFVPGTPPEPPLTADAVAARRDQVRRWRAGVMWGQFIFCVAVGAAGLLHLSGVALPGLVFALLAGTGIGLAVGVRNLVTAAKVEQLYGVLLRLERDAESR